MTVISSKNSVDWELLRLEAALYYQTHCGDGEPDWTEQEIDIAVNGEVGQALLAKYQSLAAKDRYFSAWLGASRWSAFDSTGEQWQIVIEGFLRDNRMPIPKGVVIIEQIEGTNKSRCCARDVLMNPEARGRNRIWKRGLVQDQFSTSRPLTETERYNLEEYLTQQFIEKGVSLQGRIEVKQVYRDVNNFYDITIPLGSCGESPVA